MSSLSRRLAVTGRVSLEAEVPGYFVALIPFPSEDSAFLPLLLFQTYKSVNGALLLSPTFIMLLAFSRPQSLFVDFTSCLFVWVE